MKKIVTLSLVMGLTLVVVPAWGTAGTIPASKAAAKISKFVALYSSCEADSATSNPDICSDDTGWRTVHTLYIKTANKKDLAIDTAFECGLTTFTGVQSKNGVLGVALAAGRIRVRVRITDVDGNLVPIGSSRYAEPTAGVLGEGEGIVYCSRLQALAAQFGGYNCTADLDTGVVTCEDPELVALLLKTLEASAFNFMSSDEPPGIKQIEIQGRGEALDAAFALGPDARGKAFSEAFVGAGSTLVEEVRLINGADIIELPAQ